MFGKVPAGEQSRADADQRALRGGHLVVKVCPACCGSMADTGSQEEQMRFRGG